MNSTMQPGFVVGEYHVLPESRLIIGPDGPHHVCEPIIALLAELAAHPGEPVHRRRIIEEVWHGAPGAERALSRCVSRLRRYLHDNAGRPRYIETLPGQGYRLVAEVQALDGQVAIGGAKRGPSRFWSFMLELRQRKVCRAALIYAVVVWLVYQVAEVVLPALGAPDWILASVVTLGVLGFPVALVLSWTFEITPQGLQVDDASARGPGGGESRRRELAFNAALIGVALLLSAQLLHASLSRPAGPTAAHVPETIRMLALAGFAPADASSEAAALGQALGGELRHHLRSEYGLRIVGLDSMNALQRGMPTGVEGLLAGTLHLDEHAARLAVYLVDRSSGEDIWSGLIEQPREPAASLSRRLAGAIAGAIPGTPTAASRSSGSGPHIVGQRRLGAVSPYRPAIAE
jgi:DNA-binding winged helix-turn-helix (wHTH) protein/TolB-like protein